MTHSEDYKRGLLDMLDALANVDDKKTILEFKWVAPINLAVFTRENTPVHLAIEYRKELESRKALQAAVNLLKENGYSVHNSGHAPSIDGAIQFLKSNGYHVAAPDVDPGPPRGAENAPDYPPGHPLHNPMAAKWINSTEPPARRIADDQSGSALHRAVGHEEDEGD